MGALQTKQRPEGVIPLPQSWQGMRAGMTEKTGQMMPWDVPSNAQAPSTLATGQMMGSELVGGAKHTQMEHPVINADRSGITGNVGGGRLNPYGGGALQQTAMPLRYAPTREMPEGRLFQEGVMEPRMGGEVVPNAPEGSASGWGSGNRPENASLGRNAVFAPIFSPGGYGGTVY